MSADREDGCRSSGQRLSRSGIESVNIKVNLV